MQLLIVHRDSEMGEALVQMVTTYTRHECELVGSDVAALDWGRRHRKCGLLLTQLEADGIDGLELGGSLSEIFPGLQVLFFPFYPASDQRLEVGKTKIFPEPVNGDALIDAVERAAIVPPGAPDLFHVIDILQMCCLSRRSGALQMVTKQNSGFVFLRGGKIIHAETTSDRGKEALYEIVAWEYAEFAYERTVRAPLETIAMPWHELLVAAVARRREEKANSNRRSA
jgi:Domain of unknown function (DUF4388)